VNNVRGAGELLARVSEFYRRCYHPGESQFHAIIQAVEHPANGVIAFCGPMFGAGGGFPVMRIATVGGALLGRGVWNDTNPQWSPDGRWLAFLSDRAQGGGNFQLFLAPTDELNTPVAGPVLAGEAVENFAWSADSRRILLQTADSGADAAGSASTARVGSRAEVHSDWMPTVETGSHDNLWRHARIWDLESQTLVDVGARGQNVWEASWCGAHEIAAVLSDSPTEGGWYQTYLGIADDRGGAFVRFATSELELAGIACSPDGKQIAVLEGRFHRTVALGSVVIHSRAGGQPLRPRLGAEVSSLTWRSNDRLFFAGFQSPATVAGTCDPKSGKTDIEWRSTGTAGRKVPAAWPVGKRALTVPGHAFDRYPYLARVDDDGRERVVLDLGNEDTRSILSQVSGAHALEWRGRDGLGIHGWLTVPKAVSRPPLVLFIHGGPSHLFRNSWTFDNALATLLVHSGYAVLFCNPRGSSGRGLEFAARVIGDMGGEDTHDLLAGVEHVVANFDVDGTRQFVIGGSYGGYMTTWLVGHTQQFSAACAIAPLTDMRSQYFTAHHPEFLSLYTRSNPWADDGVFTERSPLTHANNVTTPTLLIAGERDKTTPPAQAIQFHHALVLNQVPTELALYPQEGHAAARLEAQIDQGVRVLRWFERWGHRGTRFNAVPAARLT
jgi:dipeptidyl aminopeptidase/acylaminoacyl peptidase